MNKKRASTILDQKGIDVLIATTPENVYYSSGLWSLSHWLLRGTQVFVILSRDNLEPLVVMPKSDVDLFADLPNRVQKKNVKAYGRFFFSESESELNSTEKEILDITSEPYPPGTILSKTLKEEALDNGRIAIDERNITPEMFSFLKKEIDAEIVSGYPIFQEIRMVKTEEEINRLKTSFEITEKAIFGCLEKAQEGVSEKELAHEFEKIIYENGGTPVLTVIGFGRRSAFPNAQPSSKNLKKGEIIRFDVGCRYNLYYSDMSRSASCGEPPRKYQEYYKAVVQGEEKALNEITSGVTASHVFETAVKTVREKIPHFKRHHTGHGIGIELYDPPLIAENETILEENMVLCIETPYYELGFAGVQIEDAIVVKKNGYDLITKSSKEIHKIG